MPLSLLWCLATGMLVQFGGGEAWTHRPYAKIVVVARGAVSREYVDQHVDEVRQSVRCMMSTHPRLDESVADVAVEIRRLMAEDDMDASVSTSVIMSMTAGAVTVMY